MKRTQRAHLWPGTFFYISAFGWRGVCSPRLWAVNVATVDNATPYIDNNFQLRPLGIPPSPITFALSGGSRFCYGQ
jgi:hypothetical protein